MIIPPYDYMNQQNKQDHLFQQPPLMDVEEALLSLLHHDLQTAG